MRTRFTSTRRRFVAGAAGSLSLAAVANPSRALAQGDATPAASPVAAPAVESPDMTGMAYPFPVGAFSCWSVSDGANAAPNFHQAIFANADPAAVEEAMAEAGIDPALMVAQRSTPAMISCWSIPAPARRVCPTPVS